MNTFRAEIPKETYDLWFGLVSPKRLDNGHLVLEVPNKFFSDWIHHHYRPRLETLLSEAAGRPLSLQFEVLHSLEEVLRRQTDQELGGMAQPEKETSFSQEPFRSDYTFETFIAGGSNVTAKAAAEVVSKNPGRAYNPLIIYGGVGLGKTHLLHAIGMGAKQRDPRLRVLYTPTEVFFNELVEAIRANRQSEFKHKYRALDILLLDDVQFLAGKGTSQEEFFHTFNALYQAEKQIVLSSDKPPNDIPALEERLRSRFEWGFVTDIKPADLETRIAILRNKTSREKLYAPDDVIQFIAVQIRTDIRRLEGALIRVVAYAKLRGIPLTVDTAREVLQDTIREEDEPLHVGVPDVLHVVCRHYSLDVREIKGRKRTSAIALPRQMAMYLSHILTGLPTTSIGDAFGRDHTTVMYAIQKISKEVSNNPYTAKLVNTLSREIRQLALEIK